jgi:hypothetical protein
MPKIAPSLPVELTPPVAAMHVTLAVQSRFVNGRVRPQAAVSVAVQMISVPRVLPKVVRLLGLGAALLFAATACRIFAGVQITALSQPLPFFAYPVLAATFLGWIVTLLKDPVAVARSSM